MARPRYKPTEKDRNLVKNLSAAGISQPAIMLCLDNPCKSEKTFRLHFRKEMDLAPTMVTGVAMSKLFEAITRNEAWAICFWLKCKAGFQEIQKIQHSGPGGGPMEVNVTGTEVLASRIAGIAARIGAK